MFLPLFDDEEEDYSMLDLQVVDWFITEVNFGGGVISKESWWETVLGYDGKNEMLSIGLQQGTTCQT